jgi:hypothetical protein
MMCTENLVCRLHFRPLCNIQHANVQWDEAVAPPRLRSSDPPPVFPSRDSLQRRRHRGRPATLTDIDVMAVCVAGILKRTTHEAGYRPNIEHAHLGKLSCQQNFFCAYCGGSRPERVTYVRACCFAFPRLF